MNITLPPSLLEILDNYEKIVINCTAPQYRSISAQLHMTLLPMKETIAILHTPYQSCSSHSFKQFQKNEKTLVIQVGGICSKHEHVYVFPIDIPSIKPLSLTDNSVIVIEPSLLQKYSFIKQLNSEYLVTDMKDALSIREKAEKNGITSVTILYATEYFNSFPFQLYFSPLSMKKINVISGEEKDCTNETMKYVMNRYSLFDTIRSADTFMLLLLDPDWYNHPMFEAMRKLLMEEHEVVTVFMGSPDNKLLNYCGKVDIVILFGCDCSELKYDGDIPCVTPFEVLYSLYLSYDLEWNGQYPIGIERSLPFVKMALENEGISIDF